MILCIQADLCRLRYGSPVLARINQANMAFSHKLFTRAHLSFLKGCSWQITKFSHPPTLEGRPPSPHVYLTLPGQPSINLIYPLSYNRYYMLFHILSHPNNLAEQGGAASGGRAAARATAVQGSQRSRVVSNLGRSAIRGDQRFGAVCDPGWSAGSRAIIDQWS